MWPNMIKEQLIVLNLLCLVTATISAKSTGFVKEFNIEDFRHEKAEKISINHKSTNLDSETPGKQTNFTDDSKGKQTNDLEEKAENGKLSHDSMYTESDLEETASRDKLDGPNTEEKDANHHEKKNVIKEAKEKEEVSSVYTESDMEATASQDTKKKGEDHERDKRSVGSFLVVLHKRDIHDAEHEEGSGEGSGLEPPYLYI